MRNKLGTLQKKKTRLIKLLKSLVKKEDNLQRKVTALEELTNPNFGERKAGKNNLPDRFNIATMKLKKLEDKLAKVRKYPESFLAPGIKSVVLKGSMQTGEQFNRIRNRFEPENRVRLHRNLVFSWSYQKLP